MRTYEGFIGRKNGIRVGDIVVNVQGENLVGEKHFGIWKVVQVSGPWCRVEKVAATYPGIPVIAPSYHDFIMTPSGDRRFYIPGGVVHFDDFARNLIRRDPSFVGSKTFNRFASRELKREHPEAGGDFGFFDTKAYEGLAGKSAFKIGERVIYGDPYRPSDSLNVAEVLDNEVYMSNQSGVLHSYLRTRREFRFICNDDIWFSTEIDIVSPDTVVRLDEWLWAKIADNPHFVTTEVFRRIASPEFKSQHPELGADFGFFDVRKP